jgi:hypothetical protein
VRSDPDGCADADTDGNADAVADAGVRSGELPQCGSQPQLRALPGRDALGRV